MEPQSSHGVTVPIVNWRCDEFVVVVVVVGVSSFQSEAKMMEGEVLFGCATGKVASDAYVLNFFYTIFNFLFKIN